MQSHNRNTPPSAVHLDCARLRAPSDLPDSGGWGMLGEWGESVFPVSCCLGISKESAPLVDPSFVGATVSSLISAFWKSMRPSGRHLPLIEAGGGR
uniref:Uncharacterized protein n=1 Tax=Chromera velia CCMP2878 TaxID=1169474 RepID=A0A0G4F801_9ALVE|eukprot:Cvel_15631.t1-p1 / transcript=Cvel_15631.t1 / gene=Cvel_15631 / organism=Chromera_velia_CCMP2878 / gene_product=hypothetical protein / transcript_product=hypothetical protein / location=Cvel_scaffold1165:1908-2192(+) / protein_length=95 / sequence_SO=supercontig / SO=protein_coding / is_pseudo=false